MRKILVIAIVVGLLGVGAYYYTQNGQDKARTQYVTAKLEKRDLVRSISTTGTLRAVITVDVGSQISGRISEILVDFNSPVKKGQVIARLDPLSYEAQVRQGEAELDLYRAKVLSQEAAVLGSQADLDSAQSNRLAAQAAVSKAQASLESAEREMNRSRALVEKGIIAKTEYDTDLTTYHEAKAQFAQAEAQERASLNQVSAKEAAVAEAKAKIKEAQAQVRLKEASLDTNKVNLSHTIISSPVDGIVINRAVDVGQTVAASLQAPVLFTIAQDLKDMEVAASVDEADIGNIKVGQGCSFTVDAYVNRKFSGKVSQIRKAAQTVQNVVTYTVIISAENKELALLPGMTADARIVLQNRPQILAAPNAALRFTPPEGTALAGAEAKAEPVSENGASGSGRRVARLAKTLNLSPEQQKNLEAAFKDLRTQTQEAPSGAPLGGGGPPRGRTDTVRREAMRKKTESIIKRVLTPQQLEKYEQASAQRSSNAPKPGKLYVLQEDGGLKELNVMVGVSDGAYSEVRGQNLEPGMQVVTGRK